METSGDVWRKGGDERRDGGDVWRLVGGGGGGFS